MTVELAKTPAGARVYVTWNRLGDAISLVARGAKPGWTAVFRFGTGIHVSGDDPEWTGYAASEYTFPKHMIEGENEEEDIANIMADNVLVWEGQRDVPVVGKAMRQAYAKLIGLGYPTLGSHATDHVFMVRGGGGGHVFWPDLDPTLQAYNVTFSDEEAWEVFEQAGRRRLFDYMFPEVAAILSPRELYQYGPDGVFAASSLQVAAN